MFSKRIYTLGFASLARPLHPLAISHLINSDSASDSKSYQKIRVSGRMEHRSIFIIKSGTERIKLIKFLIKFIFQKKFLTKVILSRLNLPPVLV